MTVTAEDIRTAADVIRSHVVRTPTVVSSRLGEIAGTRTSFKLENLQYTGSFKDRGACYKLHRLLAADQKPTGVIAASAGNHAQGVAYHSQRLGLPATIVMPMTTPFAKIERTECHGATVILRGDSVSDSHAVAIELAREKHLTFVHPYDDADIIAGQGTVAIELLEDQPDLDTLVVPIGGGGLVSGISIWAKHCNPDIRIVGVQTEMCPSMLAHVRGQPAVELQTHTLADGIAVKSPGKITGAIVKELVSDILLVSEADIEMAIQVLASHGKIVAEGAGAAGFAAMMRHCDAFSGSNVGVVISGGNIDRRMLSTVLLRGLKRDGKIARMRIQMTDVPGTLASISEMIGSAGADIVDIEHERMFSDVGGRQAELIVVIETRGSDHVENILATLRTAGFPAQLG